MGKRGPAKGSGGRPRKKNGSTLRSGANAGYVKVTTGAAGRGTQKYVHRVKAGAAKGQVVHHRNTVKSDNRRSNLQKTTRGKHAATHNRKRAR